MIIVTKADRKTVAARGAERERQRVEHLALGHARPAPELPKKPTGMGKAEWKRKRAVLLAAGSTLAEGVEEWVALREAWSHKAKGTPETHQAAHEASKRPGALARLYATNAIDRDQVDAADQIRRAYRSITADIPCRTASWDIRTGGGAHGSPDLPLLETIEDEFRFNWWYRTTGRAAPAILAIIVDDIGLTIVAARYGMATRRLRELLVQALDLWWQNWGSTKRVGR